MANVDNSRAETVAKPQDARTLRATHARELPGGRGRTTAFPASLRSSVVTHNGKQYLQVDGYATVFNRGYTMWDFYGEYTEVADNHMLDRSLAMNPDVAFLTNHKGVTMARTTNGSLTLAKDDHGLSITGLLNLERTDVKDLASAISDKLITEMSFAFMIDEGEWDDDFTTYTLKQVDINRGDVSAVNYGANPYTNIGARANTFLSEIRHMPAPVRAEALKRMMLSEDTPDVIRAAYTLSKRDGERMIEAGREMARIQGIDFSNWEVVDETDEERVNPDPIQPVDGKPVDDELDEGILPDENDDTDALNGVRTMSTNELSVNISDTEDDDENEISADQSRSADDGKTESRNGHPVNLVRNRLAAMLDDDDE